jgi:hypothetical protein
MADAKGAEWIATNPTRTDERRGSFMVNLRTGTDFALEVSGGNLTSLAAYLFRVKHGQAAARIADALGPVSNVRWHRSAGVARANLIQIPNGMLYPRGMMFSWSWKSK